MIIDPTPNPSPCPLCGEKPNTNQYRDFPSDEVVAMADNPADERGMVNAYDIWHDCKYLREMGATFMFYKRSGREHLNVYDWLRWCNDMAFMKYTYPVISLKLRMLICRLIGHDDMTDWYSTEQVCRRCKAIEGIHYKEYTDAYFYAPYRWYEKLRLAVLLMQDKLSMRWYYWQHRNDDDSLPF